MNFLERWAQLMDKNNRSDFG